MEQRSARHPVTVEVVGSNPIGVATALAVGGNSNNMPDTGSKVGKSHVAIFSILVDDMGNSIFHSLCEKSGVDKGMPHA